MLKIELTNAAMSRFVFASRVCALVLMVASALSPSISCAQTSATQQSGKNENLSVQSTAKASSATFQELQLKQRTAARLKGNFGPYVVGNDKTCFDSRRKQERVCADFEDQYDSGQSDGQAWFNGAARSDNKGQLLPGVERFALIDAGYRNQIGRAHV